MKNLLDEVENFQAGNIQNYYENWKEITSDKNILDIVKNGVRIDFSEIPSHKEMGYMSYSPQEKIIIENEIAKLSKKGVIKKCSPVDDQFISSVFTRTKKDGSHRMILNLKKLNESVEYQHFKMESLQNVLNLITPNAWLASVDLKDAFFTIPVHRDYRKYFRFRNNDILYEFVGMPNGFGPAMRIFTKQVKPPFSHLRKQGHVSVVFVDDSYLQGETFEECEKNIFDTISLLRRLGFVIHVEKSMLTPKQEIEFLGFIISSVDMTIRLAPQKMQKILEKINNLLLLKKPSIRELASVIGTLVAAFPAVTFGRLHYRNLEKLKIYSLQIAAGNFEQKITLTDEATAELRWWTENINACHQIVIPEIDVVFHTDASELGWGASDGSSDIGGRWLESEIQHINILELTAVLFALKSYGCKNKRHLRIMCDNTTAIAYINNMGGVKSHKCDIIAKNIWEICINQNLWISAAHVPGVENKRADKKSREFNDHIEWMLHKTIFDKVVKDLGFKPTIDLFASRLNHQIKTYVSWEPDPQCSAVDAFSISWAELDFYAFPPFSLIGPVLAKCRQENALGIMIMPQWTTQYWYPMMIRMLVKPPLLLPKRPDLLILPHKPQEQHPLAGKMQLMAALVSGRQWKHTNYRKK